MLDEIESPAEYINAISKLLHYPTGKVKALEEVEEFEPIDIKISLYDNNRNLSYLVACEPSQLPLESFVLPHLHLFFLLNINFSIIFSGFK